MTSIHIFVPGKPEPAGSKRAFIPNGWTRPVITDANRNAAAWKHTIAIAAVEAMKGRAPLDGPVSLSLYFNLERPASHMGSGKHSERVKASSPEHHTSKPDALKLARAVEDALTGIVYIDDAQIVSEQMSKSYCVGRGSVLITVESLATASSSRTPTPASG